MKPVKSVVGLLNYQYSKCSNQYEVDDYIRQLRSALQMEHMRNQVLLQEDDYIKELKDQTIVVQNCPNLWLDDITEQVGTPFEITATIDPKRFPQLCVIPDYNQIKYFKKIFSKLIIDNEITNLYGAFEKQKNGNVHFHGITFIYNNNEQSFNLEKLISSYLTNKPYRATAPFKNTQCKPVRDLSKWFIYMNKESDDFIEYNLMKKNSLDL